jgi:hypothetical protein
MTRYFRFGIILFSRGARLALLSPGGVGSQLATVLRWSWLWGVV